MRVETRRFHTGSRVFPGWRIQVAKGRGIATPAVSGDHVIFGGGFGSHDVYSVDARTGSLRWHLRTGDDGPTAATVIGGIALFNTESCTLMAVDVLTGTVRWEKWLGDPLLAQPAATDDFVLMVFPREGSHWLGAFDLRSGDPRWETQLGHDVITAPIVANRRVYVATYDGAVSCLDLATGNIAWTRPMQATSAPWVWRGRVYVAQRHAPVAQHTRPHRTTRDHQPIPSHGTPQERTVTVSGRDGVPVDASAWKSAVYLRADWGTHRKSSFAAHDASVGFSHAPAAAKMGSVRDLVGEVHVSRAWRFQGSRPLVKNGIIFEATGDGLEARAVDTGRVIWVWADARREEGERRLTPPAVSNGRVVVGTFDGRVVSLDASTGTVRFAVDVGAPVHWQPVMANGRVFAGLEDGSVVAIETADTKDDGWCCWGGGAGHNGSESDAARA